MTSTSTSPKISTEKLPLILFAWGVILMISDLPDTLWNAITGEIPGWLFWGKLVILGMALVLCLFWKRLRPLWQFACVMLIFYLALALTAHIREGNWWQMRFGGANVSFGLGFMGIYLLDTAVALVVLFTLWLIHRSSNAFFLAKGQLDAPIEPVPWLGIKKGESWKSFGWIFAVVAAVIVAIPTILSLRPSGEVLLKAALLLPFVLLFAAINAFNEESYFRLSILSTLPNVIGKTHALLISIVFFGLSHWLYGSPPGLVGFMLTGFLAFLMGKSILETKGLFWAWFIHFLPDVVVFASYAIAWFQR
jgi:membrane protease YdiL (CAAX protease family)